MSSPDRIRDLAQQLSEALANVASNDAPKTPASPTIERLNARYQREVARHTKSAGDMARIGKILVRHFGDREALSLTVDDIEDYRDRRRERPTRRGGPAKPATLNREIAQLKRLLNWAVEESIIKYNPIARVKLETEDNVQRTKVRTEAELQAILAEMNPTMRALTLMLVDCGPRRMECISLQWAQLDLRRGWVELYATKNDEARGFKLSERVVMALRELHRVRDRRSPWVFTTWRWKNKNQRLNPKTALDNLQRAAAASGFEPAPGERLTLHKLRHTFVYRSRTRDRIPEKTVMRQTGHKTRSAFDRYGIGDDAELDEMFRIADANIAREVSEWRKGPVRSDGTVSDKTDNSASDPTEKQASK